ncbi:hypothetical protein MRB53_039440 [Persea americana]|nr:hypothetical protein MRB53_039440 [Persea americana]
MSSSRRDGEIERIEHTMRPISASDLERELGLVLYSGERPSTAATTLQSAAASTFDLKEDNEKAFGTITIQARQSASSIDGEEADGETRRSEQAPNGGLEAWLMVFASWLLFMISW